MLLSIGVTQFQDVIPVTILGEPAIGGQVTPANSRD